MKKKTIKKLKLDKSVISKLSATSVKGGGSRNMTCGGSGPTTGTDNCQGTTMTGGNCGTVIGCPIT